MSAERRGSYPKFGEIWMCRFGECGEGVQSGYRPALIESNNLNNTYSTIINVIPITSKIKNNLPIHVAVNGEGTGLSETSVLEVEQITTINQVKARRKIGEIADKSIFRKIKTAMCIQMPLFGERG